MARTVKRKTVSGGRATPAKSSSAAPTGRYTPPIPREVKVSPRWVPALMFVLLGLGVLIILLNYVNVIPDFLPTSDETSNVYLLIGLGLILGGIVVATQYH